MHFQICGKKAAVISKDTAVNAAISACEVCGQRDFAVSLLQTSELQLGHSSYTPWKKLSIWKDNIPQRV